MYTFSSVRSIDFPRNYPPWRLRVTRAGTWRALDLRLLYTYVYALEAPSRGTVSRNRNREGEGETRGYMHTTRKQRGALSHKWSVYYADTDARARAPFPVFGSHVVAALSTVKRRDTCRTNSEIFATPCTRRYLRAAVRCRESASNVPRRSTHNKRMRITNATVRYRVSGDNYIGRKNDTELRAIRWQREITPAMHFFFSLLQGRNYRAKLLTRRGASWTPRSGTELTRCCLSGFSCLLIIASSFLSVFV